MAITQQAKKRIRVDARKRVVNLRRNRAMKEAVKEVRDLAQKGNTKEAEAKFSAAQKAIDKAVKAGIIKKNAAARTKSRLVALIQKQKAK